MQLDAHLAFLFLDAVLHGFARVVQPAFDGIFAAHRFLRDDRYGFFVKIVCDYGCFLQSRELVDHLPHNGGGLLGIECFFRGGADASVLYGLEQKILVLVQQQIALFPESFHAEIKDNPGNPGFHIALLSQAVNMLIHGDIRLLHQIPRLVVIVQNGFCMKISVFVGQPV